MPRSQRQRPYSCELLESSFVLLGFIEPTPRDNHGRHGGFALWITRRRHHVVQRL
jgi:hypothetical protein